MTRVSPSEGAEKWASRTAGATQDMQRGIERVTVAPGQLAARQADKWHQKVTQAKPKFAANVAAVPLEEWKRSAVDGASRVASGVQAKKGKMERFTQEFYAHLDRGAPSINAMPTTTIEQSIAKAGAQMRHNAAFRRGRAS